jgi:hypothetical protein
MTVMLHDFVTVNRDEIILRCRAKVATRSEPPPTEAEIDHGVPMFLDQLVDELHHGLSANADIAKTATKHGSDLLRQGFTVSQLVHDYGDICQSITELALERNAAIDTQDFRTLNRCLDDAIAGAVTEYGRERDHSRERKTTERLGNLARDLHQSIHISKITFDAIKAGTVGVAGSTGTVLALGLNTAHDLADKLLKEVSASAAHPVQAAKRV